MTNSTSTTLHLNISAFAGAFLLLAMFFAPVQPSMVGLQTSVAHAQDCCYFSFFPDASSFNYYPDTSSFNYYPDTSSFNYYPDTSSYNYYPDSSYTYTPDSSYTYYPDSTYSTPSYSYPTYSTPSYSYPTYSYPTYSYPTYSHPAPVCPTGTYGTYPHCTPIAPPPVCPSGTTGVYPNCQLPTPACPAGTTGVYPNCVVPQPVCPSGTTGVYPNCVVPQPPAPIINNNNNNTNTNTNTVTVNMPSQPTYTYPTYSYPTYNNTYPTCSISVSPSTIQFGQAATLSWSSSYANSGWITNVGTVSAGGSVQVTPAHSMTYTGTFTGYNGQTVNCSATVTVAGYPVASTNNPYVTLSAVPYTGLDLGPLGTIVYWSTLILLSLLAAYLVVVKRVQNSVVRGGYRFLFGSAAAPENTRAHTAPAVHTTAHAVAEKVEKKVDAIDDFIMSQINRARA